MNKFPCVPPSVWASAQAAQRRHRSRPTDFTGRRRPGQRPYALMDGKECWQWLNEAREAREAREAMLSPKPRWSSRARPHVPMQHITSCGRRSCEPLASAAESARLLPSLNTLPAPLPPLLLLLPSSSPPPPPPLPPLADVVDCHSPAPSALRNFSLARHPRGAPTFRGPTRASSLLPPL
ncbi:hypothetical protein TOPH_00877 [Tolypocladium ophioglossoides CBS 100239]|uniref:Uncharacterized protein n=1 Tax=Tolypocladium ophioglossoides (strain CBS 100239) TaxID=1163406 RepID=A0A0L0NKC6_TOLOC|nr:hypothetical protein TOPH_00877 [Tolypocladium ophioglossoides CBS 100239]